MTIPFPTSQERSPSPICHGYVLTAMKRRWRRRKAGSWEADSIPGRWPRSRRRRPSCSLSSGDRTSPHIRLHLFRTHTQTEFCQPESQRNACQCPGQGRQTRGKGKEVERVSSFAPPPRPPPQLLQPHSTGHVLPQPQFQDTCVFQAHLPELCPS